MEMKMRVMMTMRIVKYCQIKRNNKWIPVTKLNKR